AVIAVPVLIDALKKDDDSYIRAQAAQSLGSIKSRISVGQEQVGNYKENLDSDPDLKDVIEALAEALKDEDEFVRHSATVGLAFIGSRAASAVPSLASALKDSDASVRWGAAQSLGNFGESAAPAVPALIDALNDN